MVTGHGWSAIFRSSNPFGICPADREIIARDAKLLIHEEREILCAHIRLAEWHNNVATQCRRNCTVQAAGKRRVIDGDGRAFVYLYDRQFIRRQAVGCADTLCHTLNGGNQLIANRLAVGTHRHL